MLVILFCIIFLILAVILSLVYRHKINKDSNRSDLGTLEGFAWSSRLFAIIFVTFIVVSFSMSRIHIDKHKYQDLQMVDMLTKSLKANEYVLSKSEFESYIKQVNEYNRCLKFYKSINDSEWTNWFCFNKASSDFDYIDLNIIITESRGK